MFQFPWMSRRDHLAIVAAKSELIAYQRGLIAELRELISRPVNVSVQLPDDFAVIQPAFVRGRRPRQEASAPIENIDYAAIDESSITQLNAVVNKHLGSRAKTANAYERRQVLSGVLTQIRAAREKKLRDRSLGIESGNPSEENVPKHIREMIAAAEGGA